MALLDKRKIQHPDKFEDSITVKYRFIRAVSLITEESINIGMVIDKSDNNFPIIELVNELEILNKLFPIFELEHAYNCLNIVKARYKLDKVKNVEMGISKTIFLSNTKIHTEYSFSNKVKSIEEILYEKYLTYSKTQKTIMFLYKTHFFKELFLKSIEDKRRKKVEGEYETYALIQNKQSRISFRKKLASHFTVEK